MTVTAMNRNELQQGFKDALPIVLGYLPLGFAFGVLAGSTGLSSLQALSMSALCLTGAGQFIAVGMIGAGGSLAAIALTVFLVNLRYALFAASTVPHLKGSMPASRAVALSFFLTDETYAVSMNRHRTHRAAPAYLAALGASAYLAWTGGTLAGACFGNVMANTDRLGMNFALPAMYISLLMMLIRKRSHLYAALAAALIALLTGHIFPAAMANSFNIVVAAAGGATLGVILDDRR